MCNIINIPIEILVEIFSNLETNDLINIRSVSDVWKNIIAKYRLILHSFCPQDWEKYINVLCTKFDVIKDFLEDIPLEIDLDQCYFNQKSIDGIEFYHQNIGILSMHRRQIVETYLCNQKEIPAFLKDENPTITDFINNLELPYPDKCNIIHISLESLYHVSHGNIERFKDLAIRWLNLHKESISPSDAKLICRFGLFKLAVYIFTDRGVAYLNGMFLNYISIEEVNFILQVNPYIKVQIEIPNEELIRTLGTHIQSGSVKKMLNLGRIDLAELIVSLNPAYVNELFTHYILKNDIAQVELYLKKYQSCNLNEIFLDILFFERFEMLLTFYKINNISLPLKEDSMFNTLDLDFYYHYSSKMVRRFYDIGGRFSVSTNIINIDAITNENFDTLGWCLNTAVFEISDKLTLECLTEYKIERLTNNDIMRLMKLFGKQAVIEKIKCWWKKKFFMLFTKGKISKINRYLDMGHHLPRKMFELKHITVGRFGSIKQLKREITKFLSYLDKNGTSNPKIVYAGKPQKLNCLNIPSHLATKLINWYEF